MLVLEIVVFLTGRPILQKIVFNYCFRIFYVSNTLPISCICTLFFSQLLVLIYLCVDDFLCLLYICIFSTRELPVNIFSLVKIIWYLLYNSLICSVNIHGAECGGLGLWPMAIKMQTVPSRNLQSCRGIQVIQRYMHSKKCLYNRV